MERPSDFLREAWIFSWVSEMMAISRLRSTIIMKRVDNTNTEKSTTSYNSVAWNSPQMSPLKLANTILRYAIGSFSPLSIVQRLVPASLKYMKSQIDMNIMANDTKKGTIAFTVSLKTMMNSLCFFQYRVSYMTYIHCKNMIPAKSNPLTVTCFP